MSFIAWLKKQKNRDDPVGDLARDTISDKNFPNCKTHKAFKHYLERIHACNGAIESLTRAQEEYKGVLLNE